LGDDGYSVVEHRGCDLNFAARWARGGRLRVEDADEATAMVAREANNATAGCEYCVVLTERRAVERSELCATLSDDDRSAGYDLTVEDLHAKSLCV
jgi:hypothetical protein